MEQYLVIADVAKRTLIIIIFFFHVRFKVRV